MREIEIKVRVEQTARLIKFLDSDGEFLGESCQIDEYYTPAHRDFLAVKPVREWLRIRIEGDHASINYKSFDFDEQGRADHAEEHESTITNPDEVRNIFNSLNFSKLVTVDKSRRSWLWNNYEVSIDTIKDLGEFVEVEYKGDPVAHEPAAVAAQMVEFLKDQKCGKITRIHLGYPYLLMFPEDKNEQEL